MLKKGRERKDLRWEKFFWASRHCNEVKKAGLESGENEKKGSEQKAGRRAAGRETNCDP